MVFNKPRKFNHSISSHHYPFIFFQKRVASKKWLYVTSSIVFIIAIFPIGGLLIYPLETHFSTKPVLPEKIDGIILLGGSFIPNSSQAWDKVQTNQNADRIHNFLKLINKYPSAKAVFTGGKASINSKYQPEAFFAQQLFDDLGIEKNRISYENKARNTYENVIYTKKIAKPKANENWIVVSSAYHLPRSIGIFCQQGWKVIPYPADFHTNPMELFTPSLNLSGHLKQLNEAIHEWVGLGAYYLTGKTNRWLPKQC